jgi:hypothetical protein
MSWIECSSCEEMIDVCGGAVRLPYICGRCEKDAALAIDVNEDLFIVECRGKQTHPHYPPEWFRSENDNTKGVFDDYSTALEAAEREQDGATLEYRVVPVKECRVRTDGDYPFIAASSVPCQSALDSVQAEQYSPAIQTRLIHHEMDICDQFDADSDLIAELRSQLDEAHAANASLTEEIDLCDRRVRAYQMLAAEVDKHASDQEKEIIRLQELLDKRLDENSGLRANLKAARFDRDFYQGLLTTERNRTWFDKLVGIGATS